MKNDVRRKKLSFLKRRRPEPRPGLARLDDSYGTVNIYLEDSSSAESENGGCMRYRSQTISEKHRYGLQGVGKTVAWGSVDVATHRIELGDNPAVSAGPPIALSSEVLEKVSVSLEDYEALKPTPRHRKEMLVPRMTREDWLRDLGYPRSSMTESVREVKAIQSSRSKSSNDGRLWERLNNFTHCGKKTTSARSLGAD